MADSTSPQKPMAQSNPDQIATPISNPNPSIASPAIASPSLSDLSQQSNLDAAVAQDYALKQPNLMAGNSGFQMNQQQLQRSNSVQRLTQLQQLQQNQQYGGAGMSAQAMRMYAAGSGQMNFGGGVQQQQLMSRAGIMGQVGLSMLPGQTAAHYALQNPMLNQQRQKGMVQNAQFSTGNVGQALSGMQSMGVMGQMNTLGMNQIRTSGALSYAQQQRYTQMRAAQQQIPSQSSLPSPQKLSGQVPGRTTSLSSMTPQQQQVLKQMSPQQQHAFIQQLSQQKQHHQLQQFQLQQFQQQQQQQQQQNSNSNSPRVVAGPTLNRSVSLTSSQQEGNNGNNGSAESGNQVLGKRKIRDLVSQVDPMVNVGDAVEDLLLEIADDFLDSVTAFACNIAKHRKSNTVETKDVLLHLEKNWNLTMPGYSRDEKKQRTTVSAAEAHKRRMEMVKAMVQAQQVEQQQGMRGGVHVQMPLMANNNNINNNMNNMSNNNNMNKPVVMSHNEMGNEHPIVRTSSNPESQFSLPSVAMMQKVPRF
ncbi:hypothetical protein LUZ60_010888 [Juncus effusus]|nr:hypothetical protein LUZ60_010888 [Juncus effusus]